MSELAERLLAALRAQGFGVVIGTEDVIVTRQGLDRVHRFPRFVLYGEGELHRVLIALAITGLVEYMGFVPVRLDIPGPEGDRN